MHVLQKNNWPIDVKWVLIDDDGGEVELASIRATSPKALRFSVDESVRKTVEVMTGILNKRISKWEKEILNRFTPKKKKWSFPWGKA